MAHSLSSQLAAALPKNQRFTIHHLSTPPTPCPAIYSAPPGQKPQKTYCESHFLSISIPHNTHRIQILALEIQIYTTALLTTIFVAKADSTGYLHLLNLPRGSPSPLRTISSIFLSHLVTTRQRKNRQLVLSLFARAQDQYLFPGSVENPQKHVLDDRGLVKWWCRVLEPVLQAGETWISTKSSKNSHRRSNTQAYLRVPGCDIHETRSFFPLQVRSSPTLVSKWHASADPLRDLSGQNPTNPERCLIPRFPDDPKSRFVDELDEELTEPPPPPSSVVKEQHRSPSKGKRPGKWRSVGSLEEFWELMAFRQECSSGRLVGFLWGVFTPTSSPLGQPFRSDSPQSPSRTLRSIGSSTNTSDSQTTNHTTPPPSQASDATISPTKPPHLPTKTKYFYHPPNSRGTVILPQKHYDRVLKLLLHLDYATLDIAIESSERWIGDVAMCAGRAVGGENDERMKDGWGIEIVGEKEAEVKSEGAVEGVNVLGVRRKRGGDGEVQTGEAGGNGGVQMLSAGLVRKKAKVK